MSIFQRHSFHSDSCIPLFWWQGHGNLGDELSPYLVEKLTRKKTLYVKSTNPVAKLVAIGSLISRKILHSNAIIWGSGLQGESFFDKKRKPEKWYQIDKKIKTLFATAQQNFPPDIRAVRGPHTRDFLIQLGYNCPEIYGDPAILLPEVYTPKHRQKHRIGLILHQVHSEIPVDSMALASENVTLISINRRGFREVEDFIDEVCSCERVFSTSLHGLIIAQAYGIPAQWIRIFDKPIHAEESMKFEDYFLGACQENQQPLVVRQLDHDAIVKIAKCEPCKVREFTGKKQLLDAFPL